ncbi:hypothetical protein PBY51_022292 [Eleginops maclovinus]|uniref:DUF4592 domain-containing protein n=1 Tax=Eleginops maclovinus TaxID=56733 RepID=A0AAN7XCR1_ELEMC|nr:hypothetical protein PBY51_022292 [Eleginops maclovinus]
MEYFSGQTEESTEDNSGHKKSKLRSLKTRLFGKSKREGGEAEAKLSQSSSDITAGQGLGSDEDLACSQGIMGFRALSHDSIFLADEDLTAAEPARVLSQENVHSKIKALQLKLQQQKMHLGPPPLVLPVRRPEDVGSRSEDERFPHSPSEASGTPSKVTYNPTEVTHGQTTSQPSSRPLSPIPKPAPTKFVPLSPSLPLPISVSPNSSSSVVETPLDFSSPAQFTPCLDTSAARHRMSIKPRNQRASTKKIPPANDSGPQLHSLNNINHPESVREEPQQLITEAEVALEKIVDVIPFTSQLLPKKPPEVAPVALEAASISSSLPFSPKELPGKLPFVPSQVLRVKPNRSADVKPSERPHSSFIQSERKDSREDLDIQLLYHDKRNMFISDQHPTPSSAVPQQLLGESEITTGIKRPPPGSGSFHFSITSAKNRSGERPRSGSFVENTEARQKTVRGEEDKLFSSMKEKEELKGAVGRLRQEGGVNKSPVIPWARGDSLKKVESVTPSNKHVTTATGAVKVEEVESSQEVLEEAVEAREVEDDEGKMAFGIKLRSTSLSMKCQSDASSNNAPVCEEVKRPEIRDIRPSDPAPSGITFPLKNNPPSTGNAHMIATEVQTTSSNVKEVETVVPAPQEPQPAPPTASSEVSWMSLAMEKTRSLQQLFTSRFPRDFTGGPTAPGHQAQAETEVQGGTQAQTQTVKTQQSSTPLEAANQPLTEAVKVETEKSGSETQTVKPSVIAAQQKISPVQTNPFKDPQTAKPTSEPLSASQPVVQTRTAQSPLHSSAQTETSFQLTQGSITQSLAQSYLSSVQQQPSWSNRGLNVADQLKSTSVSTSASASPPVAALGRGEKETTVQEKEGPSQSGRRAAWAGAVSEKAANQPSTEAVKVETEKSGSETQTVKPSVIAVQQKISPVQTNPFKDPQTAKPTNEPLSASQPVVQTRTAQSPLHSSAQTETSFQLTQGSITQSLAQSYLSSVQQQPSWSNRGLNAADQLKSTSVSTSASASPPVAALGRGEKETTVQEKEGPSQSGRRAAWPGAVSEKAAFLEKRAEWNNPAGTKGVELKKAQTEVQTSGESPSVKTTPLSKDVKPEGRPGVKLAESSPTQIPDRPREDKWPRKTVVPSSSPSSSPPMPSALQSESGQPSWMELAKRKSMAWSDKSME